MRTDLYKDLYDLDENHWWHVSKRNFCLQLISKYIKKDKSKILDVGCGSGRNIEIFSKFGECYGIDISRESIRFCKKRGLKNVRIGSCYSTGYNNSSFDLITILDVLEHTDDKKTLKELNRILKAKRIFTNYCTCI